MAEREKMVKLELRKQSVKEEFCRCTGGSAGENLSRIKVAQSDAARREQEAEAERVAVAAEKVKSAQASGKLMRLKLKLKEQEQREKAGQHADIVIPAQVKKLN